MSHTSPRSLLQDLLDGSATIEETLERLQPTTIAPVTDRGTIIARLDTLRELRHGFPEVIQGQGKSYPHLRRIIACSLERERPLLATRITPKRGERLTRHYPILQYDRTARCLYRPVNTQPAVGLVAILSAGTSDIPVAAEAALTASLMGAKVATHYDSGVAGLHRLSEAGNLLQHARVFIVVAGMEGALPSVVGGLVNRPVIAVPTSQGYGSAFHGVAALLGMLNSCAANVAVVNIDNGFGAGYIAALINRAA